VSDGGLVCGDVGAGVVERGEVAVVDGISGLVLVVEDSSGDVVLEGSESVDVPFETDANEGMV
jgi:hypothetical protein